MKKIVSSMLLWAFLCLIMPLSAISAENSFPQKAAITLNSSKITIAELIAAIENQTQYLVVFSPDEVNVNMSLNVPQGQTTVMDCLSQALDGKGVFYVFENNYIILTKDSPDTIKISGIVSDHENGERLSYASITVMGQNIGNVANSEGYFVIKVPKNLTDATLRVSYLGYRPVEHKISQILAGVQPFSFNLSPTSTNISSVIIRPDDGEDLIHRAIAAIEDNYFQVPMQMQGFYRERIKKGGRYVSLTEAVLDIYKAGYVGFGNDVPYISKGRSSVDWSKIDTVAVKFRGGIVSALQLDVAKNPFLEVSPKFIHDAYSFEIDKPVMMENRPTLVVKFDQKPGIMLMQHLPSILFRGKVYIDSESLAIVRVEFNMNVEGVPEASNVFIQKRPMGFKSVINYAKYVVQYKLFNNKWTFDYSSTEVEFTSKWDKHLFRNTYVISSEMAITERNMTAAKITGPRRINFSDIAVDRVADFQDENFWGDYNVIEPDTSIDRLVERIVRRLK